MMQKKPSPRYGSIVSGKVKPKKIETYNHLGKPVTYDSLHEYKVHQYIYSECVKWNRITLYENHSHIQVKPSTARISERYWEADFVLNFARQRVIIEAKSIATITPEFCLMLEMLDLCNPSALDNFLLVLPYGTAKKKPLASIAKKLNLPPNAVVEIHALNHILPQIFSQFI